VDGAEQGGAAIRWAAEPPRRKWNLVDKTVLRAYKDE